MALLIDSTVNGSITANAQTVILDVSRKATAVVTISGVSWSGTLQFEAATDAAFTSPVSVPAEPITLPAGSDVTSATANGTWRIDVSAYATMRVRSSAWSSGTATIAIRASVASGGMPTLAPGSVVFGGANGVAAQDSNLTYASNRLSVSALSVSSGSTDGKINLSGTAFLDKMLSTNQDSGSAYTAPGLRHLQATYNYNVTTGIAGGFNGGASMLYGTINVGGVGVAPIGSPGGWTITEFVNNSGHKDNEYCGYFYQLSALGSADTNIPFPSATPGRFWITDFSVQGPARVRPGALGSLSAMVTNYYNGSPHGQFGAGAIPPEGAVWNITDAVWNGTVGVTNNPSHAAAFGTGTGAGISGNAASKPLDMIVWIGGQTGAAGVHTGSRGANYGLVLGGTGANWGVGSRLGTGMGIRDYDTTGILLAAPYSGTTPIGMAIAGGAGPLVVGATTRYSVGHVDVVGSLYATGGVSALGTASALNYWTAPATTVTATGNEITDAVRTTGTSGDGRTPPDSSYGIWEATAPLALSNPGFETNTTGWTTVGSTLTRSTIKPMFGTAAGLDVTNNAAANEGAYFAFTGVAATQYSVSVSVRGYGTCRVVLYDDVTGKQASSPVTLSDAPQRIFVTATTGAGSTVWRAYVETDVQQAATIFIDGLQIEAKAYPTPFGNGSRSAGDVTVTAATAGLSATQGWLILATRAGMKSSTYATNPVVFWWSDAGVTNFIAIDTQATSTGAWRATYTGGAGNTATATISPFVPTNPGDLLVLVAQWKAGAGGNISISANGQNFATTAHAFTATGMPATAHLGSLAGSHFYNGDFFYCAIGSGQLVNADMATINGWGQNDPTLSHLAALNSGTATPTFLWKANTTAANTALAVTNAAGHLDGSVTDWATASKQTTVGAAGGASALPATPTGYLKMFVAGVAMVIPYYAAS